MKTFRWTLAFLFDWLVIVLSFVAVYFTPFAIIPAWLLIGSRQHALAILGHDGAHGHASGNSWFNDLLTRICFLPLSTALSGYRKFHFAHHKFTGQENDPEQFLKGRAPTFDLPLKNSIFISPLFGDGFDELEDLIVYIIPSNSILDNIVLGIFWIVTIFLLFHFGLLWILALWFASFTTSFWFVFRIRSWIEHIGPEKTSRVHVKPIYRWFFFPHNTWYHYEHHNWMNLPFWRLSEARKLHPEVPVITMEELFKGYRE